MVAPSLFISGAAAGIGKATALKFLAEGWFVGAYDVDSDGLAALAKERNEAQLARLVTGKLDVTNNDSWQQALEDFTSHTGGALNMLFNNAGILCSGPFADNSLESQQKLIEVNVQGLLAGSYLALPYLKHATASEHGARVINMSSASAIYGQPALAVYSTSKFAVRGITEALDLEWAPHGVKVMDVMPLFVRTKMVTDMDAGSIKRLGVRLTPEDIAATVYKMAHYNGSRVHWPVGLQTKLMLSASKLSPNWLTRLTNRWITR
jgi:NAD(P)-dependent dehydrogenase (short-subunit alcohol dehydrogenase family)